MSAILALQIICGIITSFFAITTILILIYTFYKGRKCHSLWIWAYTTMIAFSLTVISGLIWFIQINNISHRFKTIIYAFYFIGLTTTLIVFIHRLQTAFKSTAFAYTNKFIYTIYIIISTVPLAAICLLITGWIHSGSKALLLFAVYIVLALISLALVLLYLFVKKLIYLQNFDDNNTDNPEGISELLELQTKLTTLVIVCVSSTFIITIIVIPTFVFGSYEVAELIAALSVSIDSFVGFMCIACTMVSNIKIYRIGCFLCTKCVRNIIVCRRDCKESTHGTNKSLPSRVNNKSISAVQSDSIGHTISNDTLDVKQSQFEMA